MMHFTFTFPRAFVGSFGGYVVAWWLLGRGREWR